jgi:hypothetical protein
MVSIDASTNESFYGAAFTELMAIASNDRCIFSGGAV